MGGWEPYVRIWIECATRREVAMLDAEDYRLLCAVVQEAMNLTGGCKDAWLFPTNLRPLAKAAAELLSHNQGGAGVMTYTPRCGWNGCQSSPEDVLRRSPRDGNGSGDSTGTASASLAERGARKCRRQKTMGGCVTGTISREVHK